MWSELLPKMIGGTITDLDEPMQPSTITGFTLTDDWVSVDTLAGWSFGGRRDLMSVEATHTADGDVAPFMIVLRGPFLSAVVEMPAIVETTS